MMFFSEFVLNKHNARCHWILLIAFSRLCIFFLANSSARWDFYNCANKLMSLKEKNFSHGTIKSRNFNYEEKIKYFQMCVTSTPGYFPMCSLCLYGNKAFMLC